MKGAGVDPAMIVRSLSLVQLMVIISIVGYWWVLRHSQRRDWVVRSSLFFRAICGITLLIWGRGQIFLMIYLCYQIAATGLDSYYESSLMEWSLSRNQSFGRKRMFGSLGYATSGLMIGGLLSLGITSYGLLVVVIAVNLVLLGLNIWQPFGTMHTIGKKVSTHNKISIKNWMLLLVSSGIITLPNSFGYLLNRFIRIEFGLTLVTATTLGGLAVFLGSCVSEMTGFATVEALMTKFTAKRVILLGSFFAIMRWMICTLVTWIPGFIGSYLLHGISFAFLYIGVVTIIHENSGVEVGQLAVSFTLLANLWALGLAQLYPWLMTQIPMNGLMWVYFGLATLGTLALMILLRRKMV